MPGFLFHVGAVATCPHGGPVTVIPTNARVLVSGMPAATMADVYLVTGCPLTGPQGPCVKVQWLAPAVRVLINGLPAILQLSAGVSQTADQTPQGPVIVAGTQPRVSGM